MSSKSPFLGRYANIRKQIQEEDLRDPIVTALRKIELANQQQEFSAQTQHIISSADFELLCQFLHKPKLNPYLPQFILGHDNIQKLISDIKKLNASEKALQDHNATSPLINAVADKTLVSNQLLFDQFSSAWDKNLATTAFDKAKALLNLYLGSNNSLEMFVRENLRTEKFGRQHIPEVKQLKAQCNSQAIKDTHGLLAALSKITITNPQGHLQAIIAVIATKLYETEQAHDAEQERSSSRRSSFYSSFGSH